ncbi:MAG: PcfB family protein [Lachnospiraceae bacterium]|nr:PcfB family protein [Lachnospiraceae bacterium]
MNDEVAERTARLVITTGKELLRGLERGLRAYAMQHSRNESLRQMKRNGKLAAKAAKDNVRKKGKQTVKQLIGQNQGVSSMEVGDSGIRDFKRIANKYGVDFAIIKNKDEGKVRYTTFFKARDADAITQVLKEYTRVRTKKKERAEKPSILEKLKELKAKLKEQDREPKKKRVKKRIKKKELSL